MWQLRFLVSIQNQFNLLLMGILLAMGVLAFIMMFIFPPGSILMVFLGVMTLALSLVAKILLRCAILLLCKILKVEVPTSECQH
jgi:hypothetical protein